MRLVLDANEYIFALGLFRKQSCESLLKFLIDNFPSHSISICRTIVEEVRANLIPKEFHNFIKFINIFTIIDEDFLIPFELGAKYETKGLKEADALIAAYTEWVGADVLATENRHFLKSGFSIPANHMKTTSCSSLSSIFLLERIPVAYPQRITFIIIFG